MRGLQQTWGATGQRWLWLGYGLVLVLAPGVFSSGLGLSILSQIGVAIIACLSYNLLLGQGGMLSFGHAVYTGAGAFGAMHLLRLIEGGLAWPVVLVPLAGGLLAWLLALPLGWISTRRSGVAFAMITLALGELVWATAQMLPSVFGGEGGLTGNRGAGPAVFGIGFGSPMALYYLIAAHVLVCTALLAALRRTPLGCMLVAVRDNPQRVAFLGYDPNQLRFLAFVLAAFFAGVAGGLAALVFEIVTSEVFSASRSGSYLLFTYLGGTPFFAGPILGAVLMVLTLVWLSGLTRAWLLYLGVLFVAMVVWAPGGVASVLAHWVELARRGLLRRLWGSYLAMVLTALLAFVGVAAMVEMLYQLQLRDALGSELLFLGASIDALDANSWVGAGLTLLTGVGLFGVCRHQLQRDQQAVDAVPSGSEAR